MRGIGVISAKMVRRHMLHTDFSAKDFILLLLQANPAHRPTAEVTLVVATY